ncbi:vWA domain-containing protein [Pseudarthrobacter niigatensis]|uniref:Mg-chelatase subunit ChlD n=1 Tax=Pseudarthrobacter niigatensis TaxID=369935 RepID=A0AAJ1WF81_9MICC|nr:VWA domain-containing protein [Pseudarthrobacter niigatensis]MDQ0144208.1 Mg-chelatase subunit ChlD [Pseudarthrobacter niigatensis]MDQ0266468.1 Mg-chelatase subunit ChlD [Pseudarthrobacter niigatensis]
MELIFWWLLPLAALAAGAAAWVALRGRRGSNVGRRPVAHADRLTALPEYQAALRRHRRWLAAAATACAVLLAATAVAAARPADVTTIRPEQHNRDVMLCLDASGSMSGADAAVVEVFAGLAKNFRGERIGLTIFDSSAIQVFPLTDDYAYAQEQLQAAKDAFDGKPGSSGFLDGTWSSRGSSLIGDGLASCLNSFPGATGGPSGEDGNAAGGGSMPTRSRSVVLATDNFLSGKPIMTLEQAALLAKERSVHVYALNPGDLDYGGDSDQPGARLRAAALSTGGSYYSLGSPDAVPEIVTAVEQTERAAIQGVPRAVFSEVPGLPLGVALLSGLVLSAVLWHLQRTPLRSRVAVRRGGIVLLVLVAALRPAMPGGSVQAATADLNVFFVVDTTTSMVAEDYGNRSPRLDGVRGDIMAIAEQLPGARFSVITFDTTAHVRMPLSTDGLALETITDVMEPQVTAYARGSSITAARQVLSERLAAARDSRPDRPRLVYYLGDGEQTSGKEPEAMKVDGGLVAGGAVLGYGTSGGGRMKANTGQASDGGGSGAPADYVQDTRPGSSGDALSVIDEGRLRTVASQLGVPYLHRSAGDPVAAMMERAHPGRAERTDQDGSLGAASELYWAFSIGAFLLALPEAVGIIRQLQGLRPASRNGGKP